MSTITKTVPLKCWDRRIGMDIGICPCCNAEIIRKHSSQLQQGGWMCVYDIPMRRGGTKTFNNVQIVCLRCYGRLNKSQFTIAEFKEHMGYLH